MPTVPVCFNFVEGCAVEVWSFASSFWILSPLRKGFLTTKGTKLAQSSQGYLFETQHLVFLVKSLCEPCGKDFWLFGGDSIFEFWNRACEFAEGNFWIFLSYRSNLRSAFLVRRSHFRENLSSVALLRSILCCTECCFSAVCDIAGWMIRQTSNIMIVHI